MATGNSEFDYEKTKAKFKEYMEKNSALIIQDPLSTREKIEDKIIQIINCQSIDTHEFHVRKSEGRNKLYLKKRNKFLEVLSVEETFDVLSAYVMRENACPSYKLISEEYYVPMFVLVWFQQIWRGPVKVPPKIEKPTEIKEEKVKRKRKKDEKDEEDEKDVKHEKDEKYEKVEKHEKVEKYKKDPYYVWRLSILKGSSVILNCKNRVCYLLMLKEINTNFLLLKPIFEDITELATELTNIFAEYGYPEQIYIARNHKVCLDVFALVNEINPENKIAVRSTNKTEFFKKDKAEVVHEIHKCMDNEQNGDIYWDQCCHIVQYKLNMKERFFVRMETKEERSGIPYYLYHNRQSSKSLDASSIKLSEIKTEAISVSDDEMDVNFT